MPNPARDPTSPSSEAMIVVPVRMPRVLRDALDVVAEQAGLDRSTLTRQMLADGIRRATAARSHPALLPPELRPDHRRSQ